MTSVTVLSMNDAELRRLSLADRASCPNSEPARTNDELAEKRLFLPVCLEPRARGSQTFTLWVMEAEQEHLRVALAQLGDDECERPLAP